MALYLAAATDKLQLTGSTGADLDVHVSYVDMSTSTLLVTGLGKQNTAITTATTTDILAAPAASTVRTAKYISIRNKDASLSGDVTVIFDQNGTDFELFKATLQAGEHLTYTEGVGWFTYTPAARLNMTKYVTADSVHATAVTFADVTGLTFPVISGRNYAFEAWLICITAATTTGARLGIGGVTMTYMDLAGVSPLLAGNGVTAGTYTQGRATAVDTAFAAQTTGEATNQLHWMAGGFTPSASGTFAIRASSETSTANGLIIRKGSWATVRETDN